MTPKVIQRPKRYDHRHIDPDTVAALLRTVGTETAVVIAMEGNDTIYNLYNRYRTAIVAQGYRFHGRRGSRGELMGWVSVRKEPNRGSE